MEILNRIFHLEFHKTNVKTEFLAALTTFFTMSYLFFIVPNILSQAGLDYMTTLTMSSIIVFISCMLMGFIGNKPFAVAPLLGELAFIVYTLHNMQGVPLSVAFGGIFICGVLLYFMTIFNLRTYILEQLPETLKVSFCVGLGFFFILIALKDIGVVEFSTGSIALQAGNIADVHVVLGLMCFLMIVILSKRGFNGAVLISIITTTLVGILIKDVQLPSHIVALPHIDKSQLFNLDICGVFTKEFLPSFFVLFLLVNIDTSGSLMGLVYKIKSFTRQNHNLKKPMTADSLSVILAPLFGITTTGTYFDSMTGIEIGGRTGLTSIFIGLFFIIGLFFSPLISIIPPYAYSPALLYVGILVASIITDVDFNDISESAPAVMTISAMIFTYNIGAGILLGFLIYPVVKVLSGQKEKITPITWCLFVAAIIYFLINSY